MNLEELISKLDYEYQFVKNNKYWDYNKTYNLSLNDKVYEVSENDILLNVSHDIVNGIDKNFVEKNNIDNYEIPNIDVEQMKEIVINFFMIINPNFSNRIKFILSNTTFIKYDDNISSDFQRSVTNSNGIKLYYKNDLKSLVTLAHEISHGISNLDDNCKFNNANKVNSFAEIESELTEEMFLDYLKNINLQIRDKNSNEGIRNLNDNDIDDINYNKYKSVAYLSYRAIDELEFKKIIKNKKISNIDAKFIDELSISKNIGKEEIIKKVERFIKEYYPGDTLMHNYLGKKNYDLKNGKHLSNECRFIYAYCFLEKFNNMNLDYKEKCEFYKNYLENAKNMSFQSVLQSFNVNLFDLHSFSNEFIEKFNQLSNKNNSIHRSI